MKIASPHGRPFSASGRARTPLCTHSKDSALMSQMGHHARAGSRRVTYAGVAVKIAIRAEPEKCFFAARAYRVKSSFGSDDRLRCVSTTVLMPACAASLPTSPRCDMLLGHVAQPTLLLR